MKNIAGNEGVVTEKEDVAEDKMLPEVVSARDTGGVGTDDPDDGGIDMYVEFGRPYVFEDETYRGIDMSCLENISTRDMLEIEKRFYKLGIVSMNPENTVSFAKIVAQKASGFPVEFFEYLPVRDMMKIKSRVVNFFYS